MTFLTLGAGYWFMMMTGAFFQWVPAEGWAPKGWTPPPPDDNALITTRNVDATTALRTPQFYLLWTAVFGNAIAGVSVISCAKTLMNDTFSAALPAVVTGGFAASYVAALSAGNMFGRLGWASASDYLGRKRTCVGQTGPLVSIASRVCMAALLTTVSRAPTRVDQVLRVWTRHSHDARHPVHHLVRTRRQYHAPHPLLCWHGPRRQFLYAPLCPLLSLLRVITARLPSHACALVCDRDRRRAVLGVAGVPR